MADTKPYVRTDEHGVMRLGETRIMLDSIVASYLAGDSPESIQQQYPSASLEAVYGAITYYLASREEVDQYLSRQRDLWRKAREHAEAAGSPVVMRLRQLNAEADAKA